MDIHDIMVYHGGSIKFLDEFKDATSRGFRFGGSAGVFGNETKTDLSPHKDFMTAETDYWIDDDEWGTPSATAPVILNHGMDPVLKKLKLGKATYTKRAADIWAEGILRLRAEFEEKYGEHFDHIKAMVESGKLGLSTGVPGHLVEREKRGESAHWLKLWPLDRSELSLTPTPAEPRTSVVALKSLMGDEGEATIKTDAGALHHTGVLAELFSLAEAAELKAIGAAIQRADMRAERNRPMSAADRGAVADFLEARGLREVKLKALLEAKSGADAAKPVPEPERRDGEIVTPERVAEILANAARYQRLFGVGA